MPLLGPIGGGLGASFASFAAAGAAGDTADSSALTTSLLRLLEGLVKTTELTFEVFEVLEMVEVNTKVEAAEAKLVVAIALERTDPCSSWQQFLFFRYYYLCLCGVDDRMHSLQLGEDTWHAIYP